MIRAAPALTWALALALAALAAPACVRTSYTCALDSDCDLGELGRCEVNGRCTVFDEACPARRRYTEHSEELSRQCFDDAVAPANPCAGGQPPARAEGCFADVCAALPACCSTGWSDACVAAAQLRCELACDTRIALTALAAGRRPELYDLRRTGASWTATKIDALEAALAWLAPAPGELEPRLAGVAAGALVVAGEPSVRVDPAHAYQTIASVDLDRDGRDTVALSSAFSTGPVQHEISVVKLDDGTRRTIAVPRSQHLAWGDNDHDAFPDGVTGFNNVYSVLDNVEADLATRARGLSATTNVNINNADTPPAPPLRGFDWIDLDGDGRLDLAVFGTQVRLHEGDVRIPNNPTLTRDCDPPVAPNGCAMPEAVAFAGAALPSLDAPGVVIATFPLRKMYRLSVNPSAPQSPMIVPLPDACPACPPLIALAARDLDGDREIDLVGIDPRLGVHTALAADGYRFVESAPIPPPMMPFTAVELSVSGALPR